ncbi:MAG: hypothetical protein MI922_07795 [Bacteroidales bacterium]|nr:hypothetical protein [Bacteroidales bacterium]
MKNYFFLTLMTVLCFSLVFVSCDDEDKEDDKPYAGTWETEAYSSMNFATQQPIKEKMTITFTNSTFEDKISQGASADAMSIATKVKGDVTEISDGSVEVSITGVALGDGTYLMKESDLEQFNKAFYLKSPQAFGIGNVLKEKFTAMYELDGDKMKLILPVKNPLVEGEELTDTLNLTRK